MNTSGRYRRHAISIMVSSHHSYRLIAISSPITSPGMTMKSAPKYRHAMGALPHPRIRASHRIRRTRRLRTEVPSLPRNGRRCGIALIIVSFTRESRVSTRNISCPPVSCIKSLDNSTAIQALFSAPNSCPAIPLSGNKLCSDPLPMSTPLKVGYRTFAAVITLFGAPATANAAELDNLILSWPWALPFIGLLLSIAVGPLVAPKLWHAHYGKIAFMWSALTIAPLAGAHGVPTAFAALVHAVLGEYLSFIVVLMALYVVAGGVLVTGSLRGPPLVNTAILAFGTAIASVVGTTGAAMILIRPLLRANSARLHNVHVVVFFIFLVANIGGALSPLGDPPLFVGFLRGVDFFWTTTHLAIETAAAAGLVLAAFIVTDIWLYRQDRRVAVVGETPPNEPIRVRGLVNLPLIGFIIGAILLSAFWE